MWPAVVNAWHVFNRPLEGRFPFIYLDVKGLCTTAVGVLVDPVRLAIALPWKKDGRLASTPEIVADWEAIKARQDLRNTVATKQAHVTSIRLTETDIDNIVARRREAIERDVRRYFPDWEQLPADAQLGIMSIAWASGSGFPPKRPKFTAAVNAGDWRTAIAECALREQGNPGVVERNNRNRHCFANAAAVVRHNMHRDFLHWPLVAASPEPNT